MRRGVGHALAVAACLAVLPSSAASVSGPTLTLVTKAPLVVAGRGFTPTAAVQVTTLTSLGTRTVRGRTTPTGRFRLSLGRFPPRCGAPFAIRARDARGRVARLVLERVPCVPPPVE